MALASGLDLCDEVPLAAAEPQQGMVPLRLFYFFSFGALGALFPFLPLLLSARGLDAVQISWVMVLNPASNLLIPPLWSALADMLNARLVLLQVASVGCCAGCLLLLPAWGLWGNLLAMAFFSIFRAPLTSLADAAVYSALGGRRAPFSSVRVWGSIGFGLCVLVLGRLKGSMQPTLLLGITGAIYLASAVALLPLRKPPYLRERGVLRQSLQIMAHAPILLFLVASALYYVGHSTYDAYFSLHIRSLGYGDEFIGLAWAIGVGVEVAVMLVAPRFMGRFRSGLLLALCGAVAGVRWLALSLLVDAPGLLALQSLHGVTFGLWYLALVQYIQNRAPDHLRTSLQSLTLSSMGLGMVLGYIGGGAVLGRWGGAWLYRAASVSAAAAMVVYLLSLLLDRR